MRLFGLRQFARRDPVVQRVVAIGSFDGVHMGHRRLVEMARERARRIQGELVILTFWPLPGFALGRRGCPRVLTNPPVRAQLLAELEVDSLVTLHFDDRLSGMGPRDFVRRILVEDLKVSEACVGFNFTFGRGGSAGADTLRHLGREMGFGVEVLEPVQVVGHRVSSTAVRELIRSGRVTCAHSLLGRPHRMDGTVVRGRGLGAGLGFPTANVKAPGDVLLPAPGVYAVEVEWAINEGSIPGVANIGGSPTLGDGSSAARIVEVHIPGFHGNLYGRSLAVSFLHRLRGLRSFRDADALKAQIAEDCEIALAAMDADGSESLRTSSRLC